MATIIVVIVLLLYVYAVFTSLSPDDPRIASCGDGLSYERGNCILNISMALKDPSLCNNINAIKGSRVYCYAGLAIGLNEIDYCTNLVARKKSSARASATDCITEVVKFTHDQAVCEEIKDLFLLDIEKKDKYKRCIAWADSGKSGSLKVFEIGPRKVDCVGIIPTKCMVVNGRWFIDPIDGFDYQEGYKYIITVRVETVEDPPADASSEKYSLVEIISKVKE